MKRITIFYLMTLLLSACSLTEDNNPQTLKETNPQLNENSNDQNPNNSNPPANNSDDLRSILTNASNVRIISFIEDSKDKTAQFSSYRFSFNTDGTVVASLNDYRVNGTFRVFRDDGRIELEMNFPANSALQELDDDWYFISRTSNTLTFEDSGDRIVFEF
ncbi:hypothetical protein [Mongoliitalea lutea]|uniref:Uncharacterized protein n=1 Tax=Mongoliitalea lutea TaxID=849756 RepID=A0A8J3CW63_9BACT|nr:hypothetical protein [Mongoliitalea lutea]GHB34959.1 hypothetical protein GCM10008106_15390 [Mongoliitalea lutea]